MAFPYFQEITKHEDVNDLSIIVHWSELEQSHFFAIVIEMLDNNTIQCDNFTSIDEALTYSYRLFNKYVEGEMECAY